MSAAPRTASISRKIRSLGGKVIRKFGLLPGGTPDGLGEDAKLRSASIDGKIIVFFADTPDALYQIREWYGPFKALHGEYGLTVFCMDSRTAAAIRQESGLTVHTIAQDSTLDEMISRSDVKLALYVNHNPLNFLPIRLRSLIHISLLHGDSDKSVSVSNQIKAYDFAFVAGQAAVDRFAKYTTLYDAATRCIPIGYPEHAESVQQPPAGLPTVLYAPTWEGGHPSVGYGSLDTHGAELIKSLMAGEFRIIYRPHPLTGVRVGAYGDADAQVRELLTKSDGHLVSTGGPISEDFAAADILIADVSAVASDWLRTGKPLIITSPAEGRAKAAHTKMLDVVPRLSATEASSVAKLVHHELTDDPSKQEREQLIEYYFGDIAPGACNRNIVSECSKLMELRDQEWARVQEAESRLQ